MIQANWWDAIAEYQTCLKLEPGNPAAELGLATAYWKAGQADDAVAPLETVLRRLPADPEANGIMADILVRRGEFEQAKPYARKALEGNPGLTQTRFAMARIYLAEHKPEPAIAELQRALPADPDGTYHYLLSRALKVRRSRPGGSRRARPVQTPPHRLACWFQSLGESAFRLLAGRPGSAASYFPFGCILNQLSCDPCWFSRFWGRA